MNPEQPLPEERTGLRLTGEQTDASTGLEYLRARYCDADTGRFLSLDPLGGGYDDPYDNPVMFTDPSGLRVSANVKRVMQEWTNPFREGSRAYEANEGTRRSILSQPTCGGDGVPCTGPTVDGVTDCGGKWEPAEARTGQQAPPVDQQPDDLCLTYSTLASKNRPSILGLIHYGKGNLRVSGHVTCTNA